MPDNSPKVGEKFRRLYGSKDVVTVLGITPDKYVKFRDVDGLHFVSIESFESFFERVDDEDRRN